MACFLTLRCIASGKAVSSRTTRFYFSEDIETGFRINVENAMKVAEHRGRVPKGTYTGKTMRRKEDGVQSNDG